MIFLSVQLIDLRNLGPHFLDSPFSNSLSSTLYAMNCTALLFLAQSNRFCPLQWFHHLYFIFESPSFFVCLFFLWWANFFGLYFQHYFTFNRVNLLIGSQTGCNFSSKSYYQLPSPIIHVRIRTSNFSWRSLDHLFSLDSWTIYFSVFKLMESFFC